MESINRMPDNGIRVLDGGQGWVALLNHMGDENTITNAARVSFGKMKETFDEKDERLLQYLIENKHLTPLEHVKFTFSIHCPLFVRSQWHRHRTACLTGDTVILFDSLNELNNEEYLDQNRKDEKDFTLEYLYECWNKDSYSKNYIKNLFVRNYDEKNKKYIVSHILEIIYNGEREVFEIELQSGKKLKLTRDHKVLTKEGWKELQDAVGLIFINDSVNMTKNCELLVYEKDSFGLYEKIIKISYVGVEKVYDLTIEGDNHNFIANGIVVHNCINEISRRYTEVDMEFYIPDEFRKQSDNNKQASTDEIVENNKDARDLFESAIDKCYDVYEEMIKLGVCREQARSVLPQTMMTTFWWTIDLRNLLHFFELRDDDHAQKEIRAYAKSMKKLITPYVPHLAKYLGW